MKKRIFIVFLVVFCINIFLSIILYCKSTEPSVTETIMLLLGSYIVYGITNLYLFFQKNVIKNYFGYGATLAIGIFVCSVILIIFIFNVHDDIFLCFPIMYVLPLLFTFINWNIADKKN